MSKLLKTIALGILITFIVIFFWDGSSVYRAIRDFLFQLMLAPFFDPSEPLEKLRLIAYIEKCLAHSAFLLFGSLLCALVPKVYFTNTLIVFASLFILIIGFDHIPYHDHSVQYYLVTLIVWAVLIYVYWSIVNKWRSNKSLNNDATTVAPIN